MADEQSNVAQKRRLNAMMTQDFGGATSASGATRSSPDIDVDVLPSRRTKTADRQGPEHEDIRRGSLLDTEAVSVSKAWVGVLRFSSCCVCTCSHVAVAACFTAGNICVGASSGSNDGYCFIVPTGCSRFHPTQHKLSPCVFRPTAVLSSTNNIVCGIHLSTYPTRLQQ